MVSDGVNKAWLAGVFDPRSRRTTALAVGITITSASGSCG